VPLKDKVSRAAYTRAYRKDPVRRAKHNAYNKEWAARNREYMREYQKRRQIDRKEEIAARRRAQRATEESKAERAAWARMYRQLEAAKVAHRLGEARRRASLSDCAAEVVDFELIWGLQRGKCAYCRKNLKRGGRLGCHIDHIIPLALGGAHVQNNLQLTCALCNIRKHAKHPIEFAQSSLGLLL
jgi:5-methylcytosine-specific restriction endonuclease McrA